MIATLLVRYLAVMEMIEFTVVLSLSLLSGRKGTQSK